MKRAAALQGLSRDHLKALLAAKSIREAPDMLVAVAAFDRFWRAERDHFRFEEEILLPHWAASAEIDRLAFSRVVEDHLAIRREALRIQSGVTSLDEIRRLGARLEAHVRFEERELFPLIESTLDSRSLERLADALDEV